jgi:hypothetical protein
MSDDPEATHERAAIQRIMRRLDAFARGLGLDDATTRLIAERVVADLPDADDIKRQVETRHRMLQAAL